MVVKQKMPQNIGAFFSTENQCYFFTGATGFAGVVGVAVFAVSDFTSNFLAGVFLCLATGASFFTGVCPIFELVVAALPAMAKPKTQTEINANFFMILILKGLFFYSNIRFRNKRKREI